MFGPFPPPTSACLLPKAQRLELNKGGGVGEGVLESMLFYMRATTTFFLISRFPRNAGSFSTPKDHAGGRFIIIVAAFAQGETCQEKVGRCRTDAKRYLHKSNCRVAA